MIKAIPLTAEAFAPYGQVLAGSGAPSAGKPERKPYAANMTSTRPAAKPNMTYMRVKAADGPLARIGELERHVHSNQTFVPLSGTRHLVVVCPSDAEGMPRLDAMLAFVAEGSQAINYDPNVWHAPRLPLSQPGEFVMFRWDEDNALDTETLALAQAIDVELC